MSEHYICFIPTDPYFVPAEDVRASVASAFRAARQFLDEVETTVEPHLVFHDCGENFETVCCPFCRGRIELDVWTGWLDADYSKGDGFELPEHQMPCCSGMANLNQLKYSWPQGFSRFALRARGAGGEVPQELREELESILGCELKVIYQMY